MRLVCGIVFLVSCLGVFGQSEADFRTAAGEADTLIITGYTGAAKDVRIPQTIGGNPVTGIGAEAFYEMQLTSVVIPQGVTVIGDFAFTDNELVSLSIPEGVISIGHGAFRGRCLTSIVIPGSVRHIDYAAFVRNPLTLITIGSDVKIEDYAFDAAFIRLYRTNGRKAGTYTYNAQTKEWSAGILSDF
jgi:hypothetical protein